MHCVRNITKDLFWVGVNDYRINLFENILPVNGGMTYNSYMIIDEKTALLDTVDNAVGDRFVENVLHVLDGRTLDYLIINHLEPDHCGNIMELIRRYPELTLVGNDKARTFLGQFYEVGDINYKCVKEKDMLELGKHTLQFYMAPMVHWPEVMVTYDIEERAVFSADAFGSFGAIGATIFADEVNYDRDYLNEARRYYANVVGKYGLPTSNLIKKIECLDIRYICPLHGHIWRKNIDKFVDKYRIWSSGTPEERGITIAFASPYGGTQNAAEVLAHALSKEGISNIGIFDVSRTHPSVIIADIFKNGHLVLASNTYNGDIFPTMETLVADIRMLCIKNRKVSIIQNGTWGPTAGPKIMEVIESMKDMNVLGDMVTIKSTLKESQMDDIDNLAKIIAEDIKS